MLVVEKNNNQLKKYTSFILILGYFSFILLLFYSIFQSGFHYLFNGDEFFHLEITYSIFKGKIPFVDFYTYHSPLFHIFLIPIYYLLGFNFNAVFFNRFVMIIILGIRVILLFVIVKKLFGRIVGLFFVPLYLFDPFLVFAGMQIRPDNFALFIYTIGLLTLFLGAQKWSKRIIFASGIILSLSLIILIKMSFNVLLIVGFFTWYCFYKKRIKEGIWFLIAFFLTLSLYLGFYFIRGSLAEMVSQTLIESQQTLNYSYSFAPLGIFHDARNSMFYGVAGRSAIWIYVWVLPMMASAGAFKTFQSILKTKFELISLFCLILILSLIGNLFVLFYINSVYAQYYLGVTWLMAIFAAVFVKELLESLGKLKILKEISVILIIILMLYMGKVSFRANQARAEMTWVDQVNGLENLWKRFPKGTATYPSLLFRDLVYPIIDAKDIYLLSVDRLNKLPDLPLVLEKKKVGYLIISDSFLYDLRDVKPDWKHYLETHYKKVEGEEPIWKKVE